MLDIVIFSPFGSFFNFRYPSKLYVSGLDKSYSIFPINNFLNSVMLPLTLDNRSTVVIFLIKFFLEI